jgi:hypothetical protein
LIASSFEFEKGQAHSGMATAANKFYEVVKEPLVQLAKKYPTYKVVVVGHSLGAGKNTSTKQNKTKQKQNRHTQTQTQTQAKQKQRHCFFVDSFAKN